jgi:hypothetical protein
MMIATESTLKIPEQNSASVLGTGAGMVVTVNQLALASVN